MVLGLNQFGVLDEFQVIARQRFNLTKRLSEITQAKVVAVGDDWQSIYAFSGSDITLFIKLPDQQICMQWNE